MSEKKRAGKGGGKDQAPETQTLALLKDIKGGSVDPNCLCRADRRLLVSFLTVEGQSTAEIAHLLKVSDRTIERDKKALREDNAVAKDPKLCEQIVGRLMSEAEVCIQRIRKFQRDADASAAAKIEGEHRCFQIVSDLSERLQSLGFLPIAAQRFEADTKPSPASLRSVEEIQQEADRLRRIEEMLSVGVIDHSAARANETIAEFEDDSFRQSNGGQNHQTDR